MNELLNLLSTSSDPSVVSSPVELTVRLVFALIMGSLVAIIYRRSRTVESEKAEQAMFATLVLLTLLICMVTAVVGNSIARAFSLAGALSIVRFRTVVEDTRDTAFVIFSVVVGMAIGCGHAEIALVGTPIVGFAAFVLHALDHTTKPSIGAKRAGQSGQLSVRVGIGTDAKSLLQSEMDTHFSRWRCVQASTTKQGAAIEVQYDIVLNPDVDVVVIVNRINKLDGVQSASLQLG